MRKCFLNSEESAFRVDVKEFIVLGFGEPGKRSEGGDACVDEENIDFSEFRGDCGEQFVNFGKLGDIGLNDERVLAKDFCCFIQSFLAASGNGDAGALFLETLR